MILDLLLSFLISYLITSIALRLFLKQQEPVQPEIVNIPKNWKVPLYIEHTPDKTMFYAWDVSGTFVGQHSNQEELLTFVSEQYNIPKERLIIEDIKSL